MHLNLDTIKNPALADADKALITSHIMPAAKKYNGGTTLNLQSAPVTTSAVTAGSQMATDGFTKCINSSGVLTSGYNYGNVAIDATTSNIELQLGNGTGSNFTLYGKFVVYGDKNVTILMPESSSGATINYYFGDTTSNNGVIMSRDLINSVSDLNNVNGGTSSYVLQLGKGGTSKAPKVNLFSGPKTNVILSTMSFVSGYFYSPDSTVTLAGGANGLKHNVNYSGYAIQNPSQIGFNIIGSVVCAKYGSNQKVGVAFINPNQNTTPAGDPLFNWNAAQYKRN